jgi:hypothetical protein
MQIKAVRVLFKNNGLALQKDDSWAAVAVIAWPEVSIVSRLSEGQCSKTAENCARRAAPEEIKQTLFIHG